MSCRQFYFNNKIRAFILKQPQPVSFLRGVEVVRFPCFSTGKCSLFRGVGAINFLLLAVMLTTSHCSVGSVCLGVLVVIKLAISL